MEKLPSLREQAIDLHDMLLKRAMEIRNSGEECEPVAFLFKPTEDSKRLDMVVMPLDMLPNKDAAVDAIHHVVNEIGAMYVGHVTEAWSVNTGNEEDAIAAMAWVRAGNSLKDYPDSVEVLTVSMDGPDVNRRYMVEIKDGKLDEPQLVEGGDQEGRFTNLSGRMGDN
jgi:hypothetical protein